MKEGVNNKMKGETNACPKQGDTPVKQGDMQGAVVGYSQAYFVRKSIIVLMPYSFASLVRSSGEASSATY